MMIEFDSIYGEAKIALNKEAIDSVQGMQVNLGQMGEIDEQSISLIHMRNGVKFQVKHDYQTVLLMIRRNKE